MAAFSANIGPSHHDRKGSMMIRPTMIRGVTTTSNTRTASLKRRSLSSPSAAANRGNSAEVKLVGMTQIRLARLYGTV